MRLGIRSHIGQSFSSFRIKNINSYAKSSLGESPKAEAETLRITNKDSKQKLKHGQHFRDMLDPRDQVLEHDFDFSITLTSDDLPKKNFPFAESRLYEDIIKNIHQFLVEASGNVVSAAFKFLCKGELTESEAKQYAAKNLMLNLHSIFSEVATAIQSSELLKGSILDEQLQEMKHQLVIEVENMISNILVNLADLYPQAQATGGTPRMREVIAEMNRLQDQKNDLIFANNIKIKDFINDEGDYTQFIMQVLNTAIRMTHSNEEDSRDRTVREIFTQFNEQLFWTTQQQEYHSIINLLDEETFNKQDTLNMTQFFDKDSLRNDIVNFFDLTLQRNSLQLAQLTKHMKERKKNIELSPETDNGDEGLGSLDSQLLKLMKNSERGMEEMKKGGSYAVGQKIPAFVKQFSKLEIANRQFSGKHSSILRIMTKWAEYLRQIFQSPEQYIYQRPYPFKSTNNLIVTIYENKNGYPKIIKQLKDEYEEVKKKYEILLKNCYQFISELLSLREKSKSHVGRYSDTRVVASKINAVLTYLMLNYLNLLIHHLVKAGVTISTDYSNQNISLVVFRVSDLMRSKLQCTERGFISLLKTMYLLDSSDSMRGKFKLVRIKNKMDDPANNIIVNYLFMGRVQCELQLSIQEPRGKEKNYFTFSHFIYELTRGKFGTLAECAIMIAQLDPMVSVCRDTYYIEKQAAKLFSIKRASPIKQDQNRQTDRKAEESEEQEEQKVMQTPNNEEQFEKFIKEPVFECFSCRRLIIKESTTLFRQRVKDRICNQCISKRSNPEKYLKDKDLKRSVLEAKQKVWFSRLKNYSELQSIQSHKCLAKIGDRGRIFLNLCVYVKEEIRTFLVRLDSTIISDFQGANFDFTELDSIDITKKIRKDKKNQKPLSELWYFINDLNAVSKMMGIDRIQNFDKKLEKFISFFKEFRLEKILIKNIKFKAGIISAHENKEKVEKLGQIIETLGSGKQEDQKKFSLKYRKYQTLDCSSISNLQARSINLTAIPPWLIQCTNLKALNLGGNSISTLVECEIPPKLSYLNLPFNKMTEADLSFLLRLNHVNIAANELTKINIANLNNLEHLDISANKFSTFELKGHQKLKELKIHKNELTKLDLELPNLSKLVLYKNKLAEINLHHLNKLYSVDLDSNLLSEIDLTCSSTLKILSLCDNKLKTIDLSKLTKLQELSLNTNQITSIDLSKQQELTSLKMTDNQLASIDLSPLVSLTYLDLDNNKLTAVDLRNLVSLVKIFLNNNQIVKIDFSQLAKLGHIGMDKNLLQEITIANLTSLAKIYSNKNKLKKFKFENLPALIHLGLTENQLNQNVALHDFPNLNTLYLQKNAMTSISLTGLPKLTKLILQENKLSTIDLSHLPSLNHLDVDKNEFKQFQLQGLPRFQKLYINSNQLTSLQLSDLPSFAHLGSDKNQLTEISLCNLPKLIKVYLNSNQLTSIELNNLPELSHIGIVNNKLQALQLRNFPKLQSVYIDKNPFKKIVLSELPQFKQFKDYNLREKPLEYLEMSHLSKVSKIDTTKSPVSKVDLKDLPSLVKLLLQYNRFDSLEIEDMPNLEELYLSNCELLTSLSIKNMGKLSRLDMEGCPVANLSDLPSSVKLLWVDRQAVASYDFVELVNLERLKIDNGKAVRSELFNLRKEVKLAPEGVRIDENADDWQEKEKAEQKKEQSKEP